MLSLEALEVSFWQARLSAHPGPRRASGESDDSVRTVGVTGVGDAGVGARSGVQGGGPASFVLSFLGGPIFHTVS